MFHGEDLDLAWKDHVGDRIGEDRGQCNGREMKW